jgi:hypothetical protein
MDDYGSAVDISALVVTVDPGVTDWLAAIGTVAVAVAAVGVALFAEWRADKRVKAERIHSARVLAEERAAADARLARQLEHSEAQQRAIQQRAQDAEQQAEAGAVEVIPKFEYGGAVGMSCLAANVMNLGSSTITGVECQFSLDGRSLIVHSSVDRIGEPRGPGIYSAGAEGFSVSGYRGILIRGTGMEFLTEPVNAKALSGPYPVVRWTDHRGQLWEHKKGTPRRIGKDEPWTP